MRRNIYIAREIWEDFTNAIPDYMSRSKVLAMCMVAIASGNLTIDDLAAMAKPKPVDPDVVILN